LTLQPSLLQATKRTAWVDSKVSSGDLGDTEGEVAARLAELRGNYRKGAKAGWEERRGVLAAGRGGVEGRRGEEGRGVLGWGPAEGVLEGAWDTLCGSDAAYENALVARLSYLEEKRKKEEEDRRRAEEDEARESARREAVSREKIGRVGRKVRSELKADRESSEIDRVVIKAMGDAKESARNEGAVEVREEREGVEKKWKEEGEVIRGKFEVERAADAARHSKKKKEAEEKIREVSNTP